MRSEMTKQYAVMTVFQSAHLLGSPLNVSGRPRVLVSIGCLLPFDDAVLSRNTSACNTASRFVAAVSAASTVRSCSSSCWSLASSASI